MINACPCALALEGGGAHTKNCQEIELSKGPSFWENTGTQKCFFLYEKMDKLRGQPRFHDVSFFFWSLRVWRLRASVRVISYLWGKGACGVATTPAVGEWMMTGEKGYPKSRKT